MVVWKDFFSILWESMISDKRVVKSIHDLSIEKLVSFLAFLPRKSSYRLEIHRNQDSNGFEVKELKMFLSSTAKDILFDHTYGRYTRGLKIGHKLGKIRPFFVTTSSGNQLFCVFITENCEHNDEPIFAKTQNKYTIVYSHANGSDLGLIIGSLWRLASKCECNVVGYDYSGYGLSSGKPSERNLSADIEAVVKHLVCVDGISPKQLILYGESIGSVPTIDLSSRMTFAGVILVAPLMSGLRCFYNYQRTTWSFDPFPNIERVAQIECKVLVIHGLQDNIISVEHGIALYKRCKHKVPPLWLKEANHNDIRLFTEYFPRISDFMSEIQNIDRTDRDSQIPSQQLLVSKDTTRVYDLPSFGYQTEEQVLRANGFRRLYKRLEKNVFGMFGMAFNHFEQSVVAIKVFDICENRFEFLTNYFEDDLFSIEKILHPNVCQLKAHFVIRSQNTIKLYLYSQWAENISHHFRGYIYYNKGLEESRAKSIFAQIVSAVAYMHGLGIAHRNLKMANVLMGKDMKVLVSDFGLMRFHFNIESREGLCDQWCGTTEYMAPEVVLCKLQYNQYNPFVADVWSLGVILYFMINQCYPFPFNKRLDLESFSEFRDRQLKYKLQFSESIAEEPSNELRFILNHLLDPNIETRIKISELIEHNWIRDEIQKLEIK